MTYPPRVQKGDSLCIFLACVFLGGAVVFLGWLLTRGGAP